MYRVAINNRIWYVSKYYILNFIYISALNSKLVSPTALSCQHLPPPTQNIIEY